MLVLVLFCVPDGVSFSGSDVDQQYFSGGHEFLGKIFGLL